MLVLPRAYRAYLQAAQPHLAAWSALMSAADAAAGYEELLRQNKRASPAALARAAAAAGQSDRFAAVDSVRSMGPPDTHTAAVGAPHAIGGLQAGAAPTECTHVGAATASGGMPDMSMPDQDASARPVASAASVQHAAAAVLGDLLTVVEGNEAVLAEGEEDANGPALKRQRIDFG